MSESVSQSGSDWLAGVSESAFNDERRNILVLKIEILMHLHPMTLTLLLTTRVSVCMHVSACM